MTICWEYLLSNTKIFFCAVAFLDTWYESFLNGILGVKWTHEGALMDVWTDTSGIVSNDEITLSQTTNKDK